MNLLKLYANIYVCITCTFSETGFLNIHLILKEFKRFPSRLLKLRTTALNG